MATEAAKVVTLLKTHTNEFPQLKSEHIHAYMISDEDNNQTDAIVVVKELNRGRRDMANNTAIREIKRIEIDFYYPKNYTQDMEGLEQQVESFLHAYGYEQYSEAGRTMTPDTQNFINTYRYSYDVPFDN